jgi:pimeloyl-ACP methyl ester carboxylesterase
MSGMGDINEMIQDLETNQTERLKSKLEAFRRSHIPKKISIAGVEWEYYLSGNGPETLMLLPGLVGVGEMSFEVILAFEQDFQVITPSYPRGVGTTGGLVEGISQILVEEKVYKAHVLGGSYGGMIAQELVRRHPEQIRSLILSHTGGPVKERAKKNRNVIRVLRLLPANMMRSLLRQITRKSLQDAPEQREFWTAYTDDLVSRLGKQDILSRYKSVVDFDLNANYSPTDLDRWHGKILILAGDNDPLAEKETQAELQALYPQAQTHTFQGTGHATSIANLAEYTAVTKKFLH